MATFETFTGHLELTTSTQFSLILRLGQFLMKKQKQKKKHTPT